MANELIKQNYRNIADAIRAKTGENGTMTAEEMPGKIENDLAKKPAGSLSITENGTGIDVSEKATVDVNVPTPSYSAGSMYLADNNGDLTEGIDADSYYRVFWRYKNDYGETPLMYQDLDTDANILYSFGGTNSDEAFSSQSFSSGLYYYTNGCNGFSSIYLDSGKMYYYDGGSSFTEYDVSYGCIYVCEGGLYGGASVSSMNLVYWDGGSDMMEAAGFDSMSVGDEVTVSLSTQGTYKITRIS